MQATNQGRVNTQVEPRHQKTRRKEKRREEEKEKEKDAAQRKKRRSEVRYSSGLSMAV